jgi:hypothetical protein
MPGELDERQRERVRAAERLVWAHPPLGGGWDSIFGFLGFARGPSEAPLATGDALLRALSASGLGFRQPAAP